MLSNKVFIVKIQKRDMVTLIKLFAILIVIWYGCMKFVVGLENGDVLSFLFGVSILIFAMYCVYIFLYIPYYIS